MTRLSTLLCAVLPLAAVAGAYPVAYFLNQEVEEMRASGMSESLISAHLSPHPATPAYLPAPTFSRPPPRDTTGDLAPGTLPVPEMLPTPSRRRRSLGGTLRGLFGLEGAVWGRDRWREEGWAGEEEGEWDAYEGREGEVRRPRGMRFWGH